MNELAYFKQNQPETREQINSFTVPIIRQVNDGNVSAIDVMVIVKRWELICKKIKDSIKPTFEDEALALPKGHVEKHVMFDRSSTSTWDFTKDPEWEKLQKKLKDREAYLKTISETVVDEESGEVLAEVPMKKTMEFPKMQIL